MREEQPNRSKRLHFLLERTSVKMWFLLRIPVARWSICIVTLQDAGLLEDATRILKVRIRRYVRFSVTFSRSVNDVHHLWRRDIRQRYNGGTRSLIYDRKWRTIRRRRYCLYTSRDQNLDARRRIVQYASRHSHYVCWVAVKAGTQRCTALSLSLSILQFKEKKGEKRDEGSSSRRRPRRSFHATFGHFVRFWWR